MPLIATFKALPYDWFSNAPGETIDPFVMSHINKEGLLSVSIRDDYEKLQGDTRDDEVPNDTNQIATVKNASGDVISSDACYVEWTAAYTGTNGHTIKMWRFELENGFRFFAVSEIPKLGVQYDTSNKYQDANGLDPDWVPDTPCFTSGTLIEIREKSVPIESLCVGDAVRLYSGGMARIAWMGNRKYTYHELSVQPKLRPVRITAGALGNNLPKQDMLVSRQHRMLVSSKIAERMFGQSDVLIAAIKLTALPGIFIDEDVEEVEYYHLLFDQHQVIIAEGAPSESLFTGPHTLSMLSNEAREEIFIIFPKLRDLDYTMVPAAFIPAPKQQKHLIARHGQNQQPLLM